MAKKGGRYVRLGVTTVFFDKKAGRATFRSDKIRRKIEKLDRYGADDDDFDGDDDDFDGDDDVGDDDEDEDDDDDDDDDAAGDDDVGDDEEDDETGGRRRHKGGKGGGMRWKGRGRKRGVARARRDNWLATVVSGTTAMAGAGTGTVRIRLQHDFEADDLAFTGSVANTTVTQIMFGDRIVWSTPDGVDIANFAVNGFMRKLLRGQAIDHGLDVIITGVVPGAGNFSAMITGYKPRD